MIFSNTIETLPSDIVLDDTLECVSEIKFLGITVDNKLSWKPHVLIICKTVSRNIGIIKLKLRLLLKALANIVFSFKNLRCMVLNAIRISDVV